jgi:hypothetical protein
MRTSVRNDLTELLGRTVAMTDSGELVQRRALLRTLGFGAAAAGAAAVGSTAWARPATADDGDPLLLGESNNAQSGTSLTSNNESGTFGITNNSSDSGADGLVVDAFGGTGVVSYSFANDGVVGRALNAGFGVRGLGTGDANGVEATSAEGDGLVATASASNRAAVRGTTTGSATALIGSAVDGYGVDGSSDTAHGVVGRASAAARAAVRAFGSASAIGVQATASSAPGIIGSSSNNVGAELSGGRAAVRLVPRGTPGPPTSGSHQRGELLVDSKGVLYFCKTDGTPGTWKKVKLK